MGMILQLGLLGALTSLLNVHYLAATALAVESAILHNFLWHDRWTWGDRNRNPRRLARLLKFQGTTGLVSILGNLIFMKLFVGELSLQPVAGNVASVACCALLNFLLNDRIVFID
jgi:putative flippase GtrA